MHNIPQGMKSMGKYGEHWKEAKKAMASMKRVRYKLRLRIEVFGEGLVLSWLSPSL